MQDMYRPSHLCLKIFASQLSLSEWLRCLRYRKITRHPPTKKAILCCGSLPKDPCWHKQTKTCGNLVSHFFEPHPFVFKTNLDFASTQIVDSLNSTDSEPIYSSTPSGEAEGLGAREAVHVGSESDAWKSLMV